MISYIIESIKFEFEAMKKKGQGIGEWGLLLALIACIVITTFSAIGEKIKEINGNVGSVFLESKWSGLCTDSDGIWVAIDAAALTAAKAVPRYALGVAPCVCPTHPITNVQKSYQDPGTITNLGGGAGFGTLSGRCE